MGDAKDDKFAVRSSKAQTRRGGINPEDTAALDTADFMMTTQVSPKSKHAYLRHCCASYPYHIMRPTCSKTCGQVMTKSTAH